MKKLEKARIRAKIDDAEKRPGEKYYFWEMKGVPLRYEIGKKEMEEETVTVFRRDNRKKTLVKLDKLIDQTIKLGDKLSKDLFARAENLFEGRIQDTDSFEEMEEIIANKNAARIPYCTLELDGEACAEEIKDRITAEVRGRELTDETVPEEKECLICGREATVFVVVGRQY
ncbi:MAG: His/Gly/Thr/Pro-type tRNA ligase C-terminal domain-containing protein [Candidatus Kariarchaeaceae archaeon]